MNSLKPLLIQTSGIQYFHFIHPQSPHINIMLKPSFQTTQSHYVYSTCLGRMLQIEVNKPLIVYLEMDWFLFEIPWWRTANMKEE